MFETNRLILRGLDIDTDLPTVIQVRNNAARMSLTNNGPLLPSSREDAKKWFEPRMPGTDLPRFAVCEKQLNRTYPLALEPNEDYFKACGPMIGVMSFQPQKFDWKNRVAYIGIAFAEERHRGKGYGREVLEWALEYGFMELGLHKVQLEVFSMNESAIALYRKVCVMIGFVEEGRLRKVYFKGGQWYDSIQMGMLEEEWIELRGEVQ